jgi:CubicO group peptidase (beta-lactamase class C family)
MWTPGKQHAYQQKTFGFLVGEVVRRVTGKTLGAFFADEVAGPLGLNSWIGLPYEVEPRVAHLDLSPTPPDPTAMADALLGQLLESLKPSEEARAMLEATWADPQSVTARAATLGGAFAHPVTKDESFNTRTVRAAELPSSNMVADARSLARLYAAAIGEVDGVRLLDPETVEEMCVVQTSDSMPYGVPPGLEVLAMPFSLGFMRPWRFMPLLGPRSFGHGGAGGSLGIAYDGQRTATLLAAVTECAT